MPQAGPDPRCWVLDPLQGGPPCRPQRPSGWLGDSPGGVEVERETAATDIVQPTRLAQALGCLMLAPQQFKRLVEENAELHEKLKEALVSVDELSEQVTWYDAQRKIDEDRISAQETAIQALASAAEDALSDVMLVLVKQGLGDSRPTQEGGGRPEGQEDNTGLYEAHVVHQRFSDLAAATLSGLRTGGCPTLPPHPHPRDDVAELKSRMIQQALDFENAIAAQRAEYERAMRRLVVEAAGGSSGDPRAALPKQDAGSTSLAFDSSLSPIPRSQADPLLSHGLGPGHVSSQQHVEQLEAALQSARQQVDASVSERKVLESRFTEKLATAVQEKVEVEQRLGEALYTMERLEARVLELQALQRAQASSLAASHQEDAADVDKVARLEGRLQALSADNLALQQTLLAIRASHDEDVLRAEEETKWRQSLEAKHAALCDKYGLTEQALGESRRTCQALKEELDRALQNLTTSQDASAQCQKVADDALVALGDRDSTINALHADIRSLEDQVAEGKQEQAVLQAKLEQAARELEDARAQGVQAADALGEAQRSLARAEDNARAAHSEWNTERASARSAMEEVTARCQSLEQKVSDEAVARAAAEQALDDLRIQLERAAEAAQEAQHRFSVDLERAARREAELEAEVLTITGQLQHIRVERDEAIEAQLSLGGVLSASASDQRALDAATTKLQLALVARDELGHRVEKLEQTLERSSGMMDELTLQLKSAREGMNAAMQARDATAKDLDLTREELAGTYERLQAVTNDLREAQSLCDAATQRVGSLEKVLERAAEEGRGAEARVQEAVAAQDRLRLDLSSAEQGLATLRDRLRAAEQETLEARGHSRELETRLTNSEKRLQHAEAAKDSTALEAQSIKQHMMAMHETVERKESQLELERQHMEKVVADCLADKEELQARVKALNEALHSQQELTETWTSQVRVLGSQLEKMVRLCEENASAAKAAQRQVVALQSEQGKGAVNEEALRTELAEAKGNLAACRGQLSRLHAQLAAAEDSQRARSMQQDAELRFRLGAAERELVGARQAEVAARAECERLRGELRAARDWQLETESLEKEVSASRLAAASVQAMQHRMVRQLEVVTSQLDLSNKQRNALQAEVERLEGILADLRHQGP